MPIGNVAAWEAAQGADPDAAEVNISRDSRGVGRLS